MSRTQFVEFRGDGFWAYHVALGIFLKHLIDAAEELDVGQIVPWLSEAVTEWRTVACVSDFGLELDSRWSPEQLAQLERLSVDAVSRIRARGSFSEDEVQRWQILDGRGLDSRSAAAIPSAPVAELGEAIIALMTGNLPAPPPERAWFFGLPEGRSTLAMRGR